MCEGGGVAVAAHRVLGEDGLQDLEGPSQKFLRDNLGILGEDAGRTVATCDGVVPKKVLEEITHYQGLAGSSLLSTLARPPYGFDTNVVKASVAGLLRARKIRVKLVSGLEPSYVTDAGTDDLFHKDREFKSAEFIPAGEQKVKQKDCRRISKLFDAVFEITVAPDPEPIADALGPAFKPIADQLCEVKTRLNQLLAELRGAQEGHYKLSVPAEKATLSARRMRERERLEAWVDEQVRAAGGAVPRQAAAPMASQLNLSSADSVSTVRARLRGSTADARERALGDLGPVYRKVWSISEGESV